MRRIQFAEGEFYHVYNRGVDKRIVFLKKEEYGRFVAYLYLLNDAQSTRPEVSFRKVWTPPKTDVREPLVAIGAYCLMPNHFHLYLTPLQEGGISKFMQRLQTAYTMFFNEKHDRSGALFQGTFKAEHIDHDAYARYLFSYIHLNPAKIKDPKWKERGPKDLRALRQFVQEYPYSSLGEYMTGVHTITCPKEFPDYLSSSDELNEHIDVWLRYRNEWEAKPHKWGR